MIPIQSEIFLLSNVKQENLANLLQRELGTFGVTNVRGKRIDADRQTVHRAVAQAIADYNIIMIIGGMGEKHANMTVQAVSAAIGFDTVEKDGELFPEGAEIFKSKEGHPSGCAIAQGNQCIIMLPGESAEFQFMLSGFAVFGGVPWRAMLRQNSAGCGNIQGGGALRRRGIQNLRRGGAGV